jgi:CheY-like chemotaxis protein
MRALIIDDEEYVRLVLGQTLRVEGCDVVLDPIASNSSL